jgi:hypothetical protein
MKIKNDAEAYLTYSTLYNLYTIHFNNLE